MPPPIAWGHVPLPRTPMHGAALICTRTVKVQVLHSAQNKSNEAARVRALHVANVARIVGLVLCSCCTYTFEKVPQKAPPTYIYTRTPTSPPFALRACASDVARDVGVTLCPFDAHRIFN